MQTVLVLGAGLIAGPLVRYLLDRPETSVTVGTRTVSKAEAMVAGAPNGRALQLDVADEGTVTTSSRSALSSTIIAVRTFVTDAMGRCSFRFHVASITSAVSS